MNSKVDPDFPLQVRRLPNGDRKLIAALVVVNLRTRLSRAVEAGSFRLPSFFCESKQAESHVSGGMVGAGPRPGADPMSEDKRLELLGSITETHSAIREAALRPRYQLSTKAPATRAARLTMGPLVGALLAGLLLLPTLARGQMADGQPLRALQVPRFLRPTHDSSFGFNEFLVLGDHPTVTFTRWDPEDEKTTSETWHRATTRAVAGRLASVFHPRWPASLLRRALRFQRWGVDRPFIHWGQLGVPGTPREFPVRLSMVPPNIPESPVIQINDSVQFASHVVNIRDPDFGDSRVQGGDHEFNFAEITRRFYEHFADEYEVIAVVSEAMQFGSAYFHRNVRNDISGIGLPLFDRSADYGSVGVLQAVEGDGGDGVWASWYHVLHEQGHQYGESSKVWEALLPPLDRRGLAPSGHTPLLFPGAVAYGAVLFGDRRVTRIRSAGRTDRFEIEPTLPLVTYHPLTLYRMGLVPATAVPDMLVFRDQGQFGGAWNVSPEPGTVVTGQTTEVSVNDLLVADGVRRGPAVRRIRRAIVFVSREALVPKTQMDVLNYFARRLGASSGVTSWDRYPSFAEATGCRAKMTTRVSPLHREAAQPSSAGVSWAKVGRRALVGITLDQEVGGCLTTSETLRVSGRLTLTDRDDYDSVCLRFRRYPDTDAEDRVDQCASLDGDNRFALEVTFPAGRPGGYELLTYARWPGSSRSLSRYTGAIEVLSVNCTLRKFANCTFQGSTSRADLTFTR